MIKAVELKLVKYLTKPISENELLIALKQADNFLKNKQNNILKFDENIKFDLYNKTLLDKNELVKLTQKELLFLELCAKNLQRAVSYEELENFVWQGNMSEDALRSVVKSLRKKLPMDSLLNISKVGYKLNLK